MNEGDMNENFECVDNEKKIKKKMPTASNIITYAYQRQFNKAKLS